MSLNLKGLWLSLLLGVMTSAYGIEEYDKKFYSIAEMSVTEIPQGNLPDSDSMMQGYSNDQKMVQVDPLERAGRVISIARDLVALGEDIYRLVIKGKPSNTTSYAPISVVPRVNGEIVDILDTDRWTAPVKRTFKVVYKNTYGVEVVQFTYSVLYSYNGSYDGKGAYLTSVQIIPERVRTLFGFDFTATMKLGGIVNQGTRANPIAGATLLMEYTVSSLVVAHNQTETFFINGRGSFRKY